MFREYWKSHANDSQYNIRVKWRYSQTCAWHNNVPGKIFRIIDQPTDKYVQLLDFWLQGTFQQRKFMEWLVPRILDYV